MSLAAKYALRRANVDFPGEPTKVSTETDTSIQLSDSIPSISLKISQFKRCRLFFNFVKPASKSSAHAIVEAAGSAKSVLEFAPRLLKNLETGEIRCI